MYTVKYDAFLFDQISLLEHSSESSGTFPGILLKIPRNVKIIRFPGILYKIPLNPSEHSQRSPHSPHSVPRSCIPGFINSPILSNWFDEKEPVKIKIPTCEEKITNEWTWNIYSCKQFSDTDSTVWIYNLKIWGKIRCRSSQRRCSIKKLFVKISKYL